MYYICIIYTFIINIFNIHDHLLALLVRFIILPGTIWDEGTLTLSQVLVETGITCSSSLQVSSSLLPKNSSINASKFSRSFSGSIRPSEDKDFKAITTRYSCLAAIIAAFAAKESKSIDLLLIPFQTNKMVFTWGDEK